VSRLRNLPASLAIVLALAAPGGAAAQERVALVIGNADYAVRPLRNPVNDARAVAAALKGLGYEVLLRENASQRAMLDAMREFWLRGRQAEVRVLYYSGHGVQHRGRNFLVPVEAVLKTEDEVPRKAVSVADLVDKLAASGPGVNIVILDACRTPPWLGTTRTRGGAQVPAIASGLAQAVAPRGTVIAFATAPGAVALDGTEGNGVYTRHLLAQMKVPGLAVEQLFKRVRAGVLKETGEKQTPWETSSLTGDFCFRSGDSGECPAAAFAGTSR
jgi:uncharacterized caspase-like protein